MKKDKSSNDKKRGKKRGAVCGLMLSLLAGLFGCSTPNSGNGAKTELVVLAAASLTDVAAELEWAYENAHEDIDLQFSFAGSGALLAQIQEGVPADLFLSASQKQVDTLREEGLAEEEDVVNLLENKVVLVTPVGNELGLTSFQDLTAEKVTMIGLGAPESVPVGQYAKEIFDSLGIWEQVQGKANFAMDVRTVLTWVESGEVSCGVVYETDAKTSTNVEIICQAKEEYCSPIVYPVAVLKSAPNRQEALELLQFLQGEEAQLLFEKYGFTPLGREDF